EDVARDFKNPASLGALVLLANEQAVPPMSETAGSLSLDSGTAPHSTATPATQRAPSSSGAPEVRPATGGASPQSQIPLGRTPQSTPSMESSDALTRRLAATPPPVPTGRTMTLNEVADALEHQPDARAAHKLLAFEVRARQDPALTDQYVADAVERFGNQ